MNIEDDLRRLREDREHGAAELARMALEVARQAAGEMEAPDGENLLRGLGKLAGDLKRARPSMAPVANLVGDWEKALAGLEGRESLEELRDAAAEAAERGIETSIRAVEEAAAWALPLVSEGATVMTHSLSSTVVEVFRRLRGRKVRAILTESRPLNEGLKLAERLSEWEIPATLITEAQMGLFTPGADLVLVGADSLLADGAVVNKAGTRLLALAAREDGIPFHVCAESFKILPGIVGSPELESMDPAELGAPLLPGIDVANTYFDLTPAELVSGWILESGRYRGFPGPAPLG